ncbi:MAG: nitroreductase family protein [Anaerolineales bacterium]|nr:nitroreductase family protein [Anaerolineales bacterium]
MEFYELIKVRASVRAYRPDPVPQEKLDRILEAARLAPTAANLQPFRVLVCRTCGREAELRRVYDRDWFVAAPLILAVCGVVAEGWVRKDGKSYLDVDAAIVMDHIILAATNEGLGTCWIAAFNAEEARRAFHLPEGVEPVVLTPLGFATGEPRLKERKTLEGLIFFETWGGTKKA